MDETNYDACCRLHSPKRQSFLSALQSCIDALAIHQHTVTNSHFSNSSPRRYSNWLEKVNKLQDDCTYVRKVLELVKNEMIEEGSFSALIKLTKEHIQREKEENDILANYEEAQKAVKILRKTLDDLMIKQDEEINSLKMELIDLNAQKEKLELRAHRETKYTDAWEKARCEQSSLRCTITLKSLQTSLQDCLIQQKNEYRVGRDIEAFLLQNIAFTEQAAEHWHERHVREMQMYEAKNKQLYSDIETRRNTLQILETKFQSQQDFIDAYLAEKEAARLLKELNEHRRHSAIKIQSWWRGVMVRRKLGPYRPNEKKKRPVKGKK